ncbi:MAG TPA: 4'-phosphopantetheinyl transferase superfamily protein [Burkholderiales bacterium]|jgi:4'-phosphopantetheinyl transferase|nr:4'-phosphopantetheinyl transferase superfamily protein [Burkholderiales bacterium]
MAFSSEVQVVVARLDPGPHKARALAPSLSPAERSRAARFRFDRERRRFIVARARLRELLAERLDVPPESIELVYGREGKPALAERFARSGWRFNLSHCGELAVYAFSRAGEVGVDVEAVHAIAEADAIAARVFSRREHEAYRALAPTERPLAFFRCWTRKEAFVKALGGGLSMPLAEVDVAHAPPGWRLHSFSPLPGFIGALATESG